MASDELLASVQVYQTQLEEIQSALSSASEAEKVQLQELQANLLQLLELTLQQLQQQPQQKKEDQLVNEDTSAEEQHCESSVHKKDKNLDDEFALFQSEIAALDDSDSDDDDSNESVEPRHSKEELEALVGTKCRCPYTEKWGGHTYHNAIILSLEPNDSGHVDLHDPQVRVLFSQPTSLGMLPCQFYLSGRCKFAEDDCRFSHGQVVAVADTKEYREPEYDAIRCGSRVLVLHTSDLWTTATVQDILQDRSAFCVKYDKNKEVAEVKPAQMFPLQCEVGEENTEKDNETEQSDEDESSSEDSTDEEDNVVFVPHTSWLQHPLSQRMGDWEKHTKGIGSKLMQKMGYVVGTGLGPQGEGRVEPVTTYVYPQGVSLDRCMELREASNGEELLEVEKRLEREKRKEEAKSAQAAERLKKRTSVFDIINTKLGGKSQDGGSDGSDSSAKPVMNVSKGTLTKDTNKDLNMKNYQLSENIRQLQKEVDKMEESKKRQMGNKATVSLIDDKLQKKKTELQRLEDAEKKVQGEQQKRKDAKKFTIF